MYDSIGGTSAGYIWQVWWSGIEGIYAWLGGRSASTFAKFSVAVFKASMLEWGGRSAKFGLAVFKASMLNWRG